MVLGRRFTQVTVRQRIKLDAQGAPDPSHCVVLATHDGRLHGVNDHLSHHTSNLQDSPGIVQQHLLKVFVDPQPEFCRQLLVHHEDAIQTLPGVSFSDQRPKPPGLHCSVLIQNLEHARSRGEVCRPGVPKIAPDAQVGEHLELPRGEKACVREVPVVGTFVNLPHTVPRPGQERIPLRASEEPVLHVEPGVHARIIPGSAKVLVAEESAMSARVRAQQLRQWPVQERCRIDPHATMLVQQGEADRIGTVLNGQLIELIGKIRPVEPIPQGRLIEQPHLVVRAECPP
mmetsp:Transcript_37871/g.87957  ORF Transcript_37871/g.87957 Transcript_37871/m.87957 type:complete len:287 (+) Transcript_37871:106-966(+)